MTKKHNKFWWYGNTGSSCSKDKEYGKLIQKTHQKILAKFNFDFLFCRKDFKKTKPYKGDDDVSILWQ